MSAILSLSGAKRTPSRSTAASGGSPRMGVRRRLGQGMDPRIGYAICLGQQPGVLHTLLVAVEAATGAAGPRAPWMLDVGFTRRGPATKTSDERRDGRGRAAQQLRRAPAPQSVLAGESFTHRPAPVLRASLYAFPAPGARVTHRPGPQNAPRRPPHGLRHHFGQQNEPAARVGRRRGLIPSSGAGAGTGRRSVPNPPSLRPIARRSPTTRR
jgi:hypothetical protein